MRALAIMDKDGEDHGKDKPRGCKTGDEAQEGKVSGVLGSGLHARLTWSLLGLHRQNVWGLIHNPIFQEDPPKLACQKQ